MITKEKYEEVLRTLDSGKAPDVYGADVDNFEIIRPAYMRVSLNNHKVYNDCTLCFIDPQDLYYTKEEAALVLMRELFTKLDREMKND